MSNIHSTAIIDSTAEIHASTVIGPYCIIGPSVTIGADCILHNHVNVQALTAIGCENEIHPFVVLGAIPQDRKFQGEKSWCVIGDRNRIREHATVHRGTSNGGGSTRIGSDNLIMVATHVAHDCIIGDNTTIANQTLLAGHVLVEDGANIGGGVGIHHFVTIGSCSFVGGMARIPRDVPPFMIVEGNPAEVRATNSIAMARLGYETKHIDAMKDAHKRLFRDNVDPMHEKISDLRHRYADVQAIKHLCDSLEAAAQGVHGRARENFRPDDKRATRIHPSLSPSSGSSSSSSPSSSSSK